MLPSVICSHVVADRIADQVSGAVSAPHDHGCAQIGQDNEQTKRTLLGVATNPNVSGTLVVGLGCEHIRSGDLATELAEFDNPVRELVIQDEGGTDSTIERGVEIARELASTSAAERTAADPATLTVGIVSSDLTEETIETAGPLVGDFVDRVIDGGGRVVAAGIEPVLAHPTEAREHSTGDAIDEIEALLNRHANLPARNTRIRRAAGDLSFREATRAWGNQPITDVLEYGNRVSPTAGLSLVDAPSQFEEAATGLVAAGAQIIIHVTDDGIPTGHPIAPVVKVTGNEQTYEALESDIDVFAGETGPTAFQEKMTSILEGEKSRAEEHGLSEFAITRVGPTM